jgi:hypothetical protein
VDVRNKCGHDEELASLRSASGMKIADQAPHSSSFEARRLGASRLGMTVKNNCHPEVAERSEVLKGWRPVLAQS